MSTDGKKPLDSPIRSAMASTSSVRDEVQVSPVYLNLYDLGGCTNTLVHSMGLLFYHCAVQAHSAEYGCEKGSEHVS